MPQYSISNQRGSFKKSHQHLSAQKGKTSYESPQEDFFQVHGVQQIESIQTHDKGTHGTHGKQKQQRQLRKPLPWIIFIVVVSIEATSTFYSAYSYTRKSGVYEFFCMNLGFSTVLIGVSLYLMWEKKMKLLLLYTLLDPLMIIVLCLVATYAFPYYAMQRTSWEELLEVASYSFYNLVSVGNFRILMADMVWSKGRVVVYKLQKLIWTMFYLFFGIYFIMNDISYSKGQDTNLDDQIQELVILFVFTAFALQLEFYNRISDFDGTSELDTRYLILPGSQKEETDSYHGGTVSEDIKEKIQESAQNLKPAKLRPFRPSKQPKIQVVSGSKVF